MSFEVNALTGPRSEQFQGGSGSDLNTLPDKDPTLRDLLRILHRRKRAVVVTASVVFLLAVCACIFMTRRYTAISVIQLEKSSDSLGLDTLMGAAGGGASDALSVNIDLQTQANILQSEALALKVIRDLNLEQNDDFKPHFSPLGWLTGLLSPRGPADPVHASLEDSPGRRGRVVRAFSSNLKVKVTAGTRLLEVDYTNRDPKVAAAVVNHLVQALIDYTFQTKFIATNQVSHWLEGQLGDLRKQSEQLQTRVVALQQGSGIFGVGGTDPQGKPVMYSPVLDRLQQSTAQLSQAQMNRVLKASVAEVVKTGNAELISQLSGTSIAGSSGVINSLALIQNLRLQEATLQAQIDQDASQFGSAYPKLIQERASMKGVQQSLQQEIERTAERSRNDLKVATQAERGARAAYENDRSEAEKLNDKSIEYAILSKEANQSQDLYQDLLKRLKEAGILEGLHSSNVTVVDQASAPARPSKPQVPLYLILGAGLGAFFGCCAALLIDAVDNKIQGAEEIDALQIPLLGIAPQIESSKSGARAIMLDARHNDAAFGESVRRLRSGLLISRSGRPPQVLLVSSASPGEGKSTLALNLAASLSQYEKKVLLVEADMRRPVLRKRLGLQGGDGLSVLLSDRDSPNAIVAVPDNPNLYLLPGGPTPPYPAELLGSPRMQALMEEWRTEFDFIVVDSPPVLPVTDAQLLEEMADATVLLARVGFTSRAALERAYKLLLLHRKDAARPAIGVLLNFVARSSSAYYGYYGYYGSKKYEYQQG